MKNLFRTAIVGMVLAITALSAVADPIATKLRPGMNVVDVARAFPSARAPNLKRELMNGKATHELAMETMFAGQRLRADFFFVDGKLWLVKRTFVNMDTIGFEEAYAIAYKVKAQLEKELGAPTTNKMTDPKYSDGLANQFWINRKPATLLNFQVKESQFIKKPYFTWDTNYGTPEYD